MVFLKRSKESKSDRIAYYKVILIEQYDMMILSYLMSTSPSFHLGSAKMACRWVSLIAICQAVCAAPQPKLITISISITLMIAATQIQRSRGFWIVSYSRLVALWSHQLLPLTLRNHPLRQAMPILELAFRLRETDWRREREVMDGCIGRGRERRMDRDRDGEVGERREREMESFSRSACSWMRRPPPVQ